MKKFFEKLIINILSSTPENEKKKIDKGLIEFFGILIALTIIFLIWLYYPSFIAWMDHPNPKVMIPLKPSAMVPELINPNDFNKIGEKFGTYGDSYGSLNTLFSGFAFAILIISLFMQRQELAAQRKELEAQRHEIKESNAIAEAQRKITEQQAQLIEQQLLDSKSQAFYQLFFKYLEEKQRKLGSLGSHINSKVPGEIVLKDFRISFENRFFELFKDSKHLEDIDTDILDNVLNQALLFAKNSTSNKLMESEYFEYVCFILRFIEENKSIGIVDNAIKTFIAYQSVNEMYCMLLLALEDEELYDFIEKYTLLRKINTYDDPDLKRLIFNFYSESAYCIY
ncbi:hypothetical protein QSV37_17595 [Acinetobacter sp. VNK23]|uniref:hypothetical protein n=1 Tax=Acinetobacter thutiue TaxID=2998078 RepID=UPI0025765E72|nr:hypothetical protein [Acinetobacter thutiue]MDM1022089.1 hypothetical protein [Acinetobacter thutiue]